MKSATREGYFTPRGLQQPASWPLAPYYLPSPSIGADDCRLDYGLGRLTFTKLKKNILKKTKKNLRKQKVLI